MPTLKVNEVLFNDGEGITSADLNNLQRFLKSSIQDQGMGSDWRIDPEHPGTPDIVDGNSVGIWNYPLVAHSGACFPYPGAGTREVTNGAGVLYQWISNSVPDGLTSSLLEYQCSADELSTTIAANASGNPRIDAICIKIANNDAADAETRNFKDATTGVVTSTTPYKKRTTTLAISVVQGTAAAAPELPTATSGYVVWAYVYVPNAYATTFTTGHIADNRMPARLKVMRTYARDLIAPYSSTAGDIWHVGNNGLVAYTQSNTALRGYFPFHGGATARILRINIYGSGGDSNTGLTAGVSTAKLFVIAGNYPAASQNTFSTFYESQSVWAQSTTGTGCYLQPPGNNFSTPLYDPNLAHHFRSSLEGGNTPTSMPTVWGNGTTCGTAAFNVGTSSSNSALLTVSILVAGATHPNEYFQCVEWYYAE